MRTKRLFTQNRMWLLLAVLITAGSAIVGFAPSLHAAAVQAPDAPRLAQRQVFNDDLTVRTGESIDGDAVVYRGDVTVESGGAIRGNLIVYDGDIEIKRGGVVSGNVTAFSGEVEIAGAVDGSVTSLSGDVKLQNSAVVGGDISVVSGEVEQDRGAQVQGNVLHGPSIQLDLPRMPELPAIPELGALPAPPRPAPPSPIELLFTFVGRVLQALLILGVAVLTGGALLKWRPALIEEMRTLLVARTALAFAAGLIFNLFGLALIGLLWITICFRPPALLLGLLFAAINLVGIAVVGDEIGRMIDARLRIGWPQPWRTAVGIVAPGAVIAFLWILGSCFSFFAFVGAVVFTSFGAGAILVKFLKLGEPKARAAQAAPVAAPPAEDALAQAEIVADTDSTRTAAAAVPATADLTEAAAAAPAAEAAAPAVEGETPAAAVPAELDDFTRINGVGPVFAGRLKAAGINTFADLAALTPAEIAAIIKWSEERVIRTEIIAQARQFVQGGA